MRRRRVGADEITKKSSYVEHDLVRAYRGVVSCVRVESLQEQGRIRTQLGDLSLGGGLRRRVSADEIDLS